jgi:transposase
MACATFLSLIETAKANGLEPYSYLRHIFKKLPLVQTPDEYRALLPQYVDRDAVNSL